MAAPRDHAALVQVAKRYYQLGQSQEEIARAMGTSRSNVSRMLSAAQQRGIVEIRVHDSVPREPALEESLLSRFGLHDAVVASRPVGSPVDGADADQLGEVAWLWLRDELKDGMTVAMSWGRALQAVVRAASGVSLPGVEVLQLMGGLAQRASFVTAQELVREFAGRLGAGYRYLHAPAAFETAVARDAMTAEPAIAEALDAARRADLALVGIGSVVDGSSAAILDAVGGSREERAAFEAAGPVGDIAGRYFTADGVAITGAIDDRVLGLTLAEIAAIPRVVGIAAGPQKVPGVLGALRGGMLDVLVCDADTAEAVLNA